MNRRNSAGTAILFMVMAVVPTACTAIDTSFTVENGLCYRTRTTKTAGCQTHKEKVLAVPENCGLPEPG